MQLEEKKYLYDVLRSVERIEKFSAGKSVSDYLQDDLLQAGIERQFEIIGEAVSKLSKLSPEIAEKLPGRRKMISFRNILIHAYDTIDPMIVWGVVETEVENLKQTISQLMDTDGD